MYNRSAIDLKQMVDLGIIPCVYGIKEKINNSLELKLHQAMINAELNKESQLKLIGTLIAMMTPSEGV